MLFSKPEVLAPAGSREAMVAAVRSGADAVYMGAKQFSARRNAENFDEKELKEAVEFCRVRGVKVYLTLNIMIKDSEILDALAVVEHAYSCGIDGIIIADLGLAKIVRSTFPLLPLHASTQMTVHSPAALYELKSLGISRVVAAREMSKQALADLCATAKELDMDYQLEVMSGHSGTNAWPVQISREGVATAVLSLPLRYMHSPSEVCQILDIEYAINLLANFLCTINEDTILDPFAE